MDKQMSSGFYVLRKVDCPRCEGTGIVWKDGQDYSCPKCNERGFDVIEIPLEVALKSMGIDVEAIQNAQRQARHAADVASMLANGILPD